jgi:hypothetical protein
MDRNQKSTTKIGKKGGKKRDKEFVDIFGINNSQGEINQENEDLDDERALTGEEKNLLK